MRPSSATTTAAMAAGLTAAWGLAWSLPAACGPLERGTGQRRQGAVRHAARSALRARGQSAARSREGRGAISKGRPWFVALRKTWTPADRLPEAAVSGTLPCAGRLPLAAPCSAGWCSCSRRASQATGPHASMVLGAVQSIPHMVLEVVDVRGLGRKHRVRTWCQASGPVAAGVGVHAASPSDLVGAGEEGGRTAWQSRCRCRRGWW